MPSLWLNVLAQYPLPTTTHEPLQLGRESAAFAPLQTRARKERFQGIIPSQKQLPNDRLLATPGSAPDDSATLAPLSPEDASKLDKILKQFCTQLSTLSDTNRLSGQTYAAPLLEHLNKSLSAAESITGNQTSYAQMLMRWAFVRLQQEGDKISSVKTYLSRLTPPPIVFHDDVADMLQWDQDTVDELEALAQLYPGWQEASHHHFLHTLNMLIRFCQEVEVLDDSITSQTPGTPDTVSTLRTSIANPTLMDQAWHRLVGDTDNPSQIHQQMALALALGYYGGLRASEVCQLTLADIRIEPARIPGWESLSRHYGQHYSEDEPFPVETMCWVYIRRGKTSSARRRVPLHVLAPPEVVARMQQWWVIRQKFEPNEAYHRIALFGPLFSPKAYTRQGLIDPLITWLRIQWGSAVDFHALRHAAVSWLQLRVHAAQYPDFRDRLAHRHHWMFSQTALKALYRYLCGAEGTDAELRGSQIAQIAKIIGHRHTATLMHTYSHTLPLIHGDILRRVWTNQKLSH